MRFAIVLPWWGYVLLFGAAIVLGWLAYLRGNGALAGIAVDQVLDTGPGNGMLRILDDALRAALDPSTFQASMRELRGILARP